MAAVLMCRGAELDRAERNGRLVTFFLTVPEEKEEAVRQDKELVRKQGYGLLVDLGQFLSHMTHLRNKISELTGGRDAGHRGRTG